MKTSKHTPGPWMTKKDRFGNPCQIHSKDKHITDVCGFGPNGTTNFSEDEANAKLIASAPELLEALKAIVQELKTDSPKLSSYKKEIMHRAEVAIQKATV